MPKKKLHKRDFWLISFAPEGETLVAKSTLQLNLPFFYDYLPIGPILVTQIVFST